MLFGLSENGCRVTAQSEMACAFQEPEQAVAVVSGHLWVVENSCDGLRVWLELWPASPLARGHKGSKGKSNRC